MCSHVKHCTNTILILNSAYAVEKSTNSFVIRFKQPIFDVVALRLDSVTLNPSLNSGSVYYVLVDVERSGRQGSLVNGDRYPAVCYIPTSTTNITLPQYVNHNEWPTIQYSTPTTLTQIIISVIDSNYNVVNIYADAGYSVFLQFTIEQIVGKCHIPECN
jgi:hypothetical protein